MIHPSKVPSRQVNLRTVIVSAEHNEARGRNLRSQQTSEKENFHREEHRERQAEKNIDKCMEARSLQAKGSQGCMSGVRSKNGENAGKGKNVDQPLITKVWSSKLQECKLALWHSEPLQYFM